MKKILVTSDFSAASKAAIRFAISLLRQGNYQLTFFYVYSLEKPVSWSSKKFETYAENEKIKNLNALKAIVFRAAGNAKDKSKSFEFLVREGANASEEILNHAVKNKFDFICVGTKGAGMVKRIFGTHTSWLLQHSKIPVMCIPHTYRSSKIKNILYASDLTNLTEEMKVVSHFSKPLRANLGVVHFDLNADPAGVATLGSKDIGIIHKQGANLIFANQQNGFLSDMKPIISKSKPSILIMFTVLDRSLVSRVMHQSLSAGLSFETSVPMLVFNKKRKS